MADLFTRPTATRAEVEAAQASLAPSAHCGGHGMLDQMAQTTMQWRVRCRNAWCFSTTSPRASVVEAARVWNRRPDSARPSEFWAPHSTLDPRATA